MFTLLQTLNDNLPKTIGYPWEGTKDQKPIYFEDALGRTTILPVLLCSSKDVWTYPVHSKRGVVNNWYI